MHNSEQPFDARILINDGPSPSTSLLSTCPTLTLSKNFCKQRTIKEIEKHKFDWFDNVLNNPYVLNRNSQVDNKFSVTCKLSKLGKNCTAFTK